MTFTEWYLQNKSPDDIFDPPMSAEQVLDFLIQYLLPENYHTGNITASQANTEIVQDILMKYSKKFKKEVKQYAKLQYQCNRCQYCPRKQS